MSVVKRQRQSYAELTSIIPGPLDIAQLFLSEGQMADKPLRPVAELVQLELNTITDCVTRRVYVTRTMGEVVTRGS